MDGWMDGWMDCCAGEMVSFVENLIDESCHRRVPQWCTRVLFVETFIYQLGVAIFELYWQ